MLRQIEHGVEELVSTRLRLIGPQGQHVAALVVKEPALRKPGDVALDRHPAHGEEIRRLDLAETVSPRGAGQEVGHAPTDVPNVFHPTDNQRGLLQARLRREAKDLRLHCRDRL
jgi:hypothetical protein